MQDHCFIKNQYLLLQIQYAESNICTNVQICLGLMLLSKGLYVVRLNSFKW